MAKLEIMHAPAPRLKRICRPVERVDDDVRRLMDDMLETMHAADGIGLAATQVDVLRRVIVVSVRRDGAEPLTLRMANPEVIEASDEQRVWEEGCLSFPEQYADVSRPKKVRVRYLDYENEIREIEDDGLLATCVQHEIDHLDGITFVDHISALKRNMILRKMKKAKRQAETVPA